MDEGVILRTVDEREMSRGLLINPLLSRHFGGIWKEDVVKSCGRKCSKKFRVRNEKKMARGP